MLMFLHLTVYVPPKTSFATTILELAFQEDHLVF